jgi:hypothetical protein
MKPFSQAFIDQLIREILYLKFFSTLFSQSKTELIIKFHFFDDFLRILIDFIDSSSCDKILNRSSHHQHYYYRIFNIDHFN